VTTPHDSAGGHVHRLLDEAFAGVEMTPERQDLKEEMRANLLARVAELEATGVAPQPAARRAVAELGDVRDVLDAGADDDGPPAPDWQTHRVRPDPRYLVRTVLLAALTLAALVPPVLATTGVAVSLAALAAAVAVVAVAAAALTADALRQETTTNHPMPGARAAGYGLGVALAVAALGTGWLYLHEGGAPTDPRAGGPAWLLVGVLVVASAAVFTWLGATQTNRHKPWVVRTRAEQTRAGDRFTRDPAAAARFGIYVVVVWLLALAAFVVLTLTAGWAWSWLALLGGLAAMMLTLARMLFASHS
jgi:MFS family permease